VFKPEWAEALETIPEVYVCFGRDPVGYEGMQCVGRLLPHFKLVELAAEVGDSGRGEPGSGKDRVSAERRCALLQTVSPKDITRWVQDRHGDEYERKITTKWVGNIIRRELQLRPVRASSGYDIPPEEFPKVDRPYERHGVGSRTGEMEPTAASSTAMYRTRVQAAAEPGAVVATGEDASADFGAIRGRGSRSA
jgi:hypothetical protein